MKAIELRLGNYVIEENGLDAIITGIDDLTRVSTDNGFFPYTPIENIKPIPLTEEWLVKFGFTKASLRNCYYKTWGENGVEDVVYEYHYKGGFEYELGPNRYKTIEYVHQLQNLYFALTGTELTIK